MARRRQTLTSAFVDSSVLFAAVSSPSGGSAKLLTLPSLELVTSKLVLTEVERNVRKKLQTYHLERFFTLASKLEVRDTVIDEKMIISAKKVIVDKDAAILAEAKKSRVRYLVTLDRKDFFQSRVFAYIKPAKIVTPGELITALSGKTPPNLAK